ncbi:MAG: hypothetical protein ACK5HR_03060 [Mycoplasmatales bacterium]
MDDKIAIALDKDKVDNYITEMMEQGYEVESVQDSRKFVTIVLKKSK